MMTQISALGLVEAVVSLIKQTVFINLQLISQMIMYCYVGQLVYCNLQKLL